MPTFFHIHQKNSSYFYTLLHIGVILVLLALSTETFALEGLDTLKTAIEAALVGLACAEHRDDAGFLKLLLEPRLKSVVTFLAFPDCEYCHRAGIG